MKRASVLALALCLLGGSLMSAAVAGRSRLVPGETTFYLRANDAGCQTGFGLSIHDGPDAANCGYIDAGLAQEVANAALGEYTTARTWFSQDGVPITLDASRPVTTNITLKSFQAPSPVALGAGQALFDVTLTGFADGEQVVVGHAEHSYLVTPGTYEYRLRFDIDVPDELQGVTLTSLEMTTVLRGPVLLHGAFSVDNPSSSIAVPTLVKKRAATR